MERDLTEELADARRDIDALQRRLDALEHDRRADGLPSTMLLDHSFLKRAFAVLGHYFVAGLIVSIPFYLLFFLIALVAGGSW